MDSEKPPALVSVFKMRFVFLCAINTVVLLYLLTTFRKCGHINITNTFLPAL